MIRHDKHPDKHAISLYLYRLMTWQKGHDSFDYDYFELWIFAGYQVFQIYFVFNMLDMSK